MTPNPTEDVTFSSEQAITIFNMMDKSREEGRQSVLDQIEKMIDKTQRGCSKNYYFKNCKSEDIGHSDNCFTEYKCNKKHICDSCKAKLELLQEIKRLGLTEPISTNVEKSQSSEKEVVGITHTMSDSDHLKKSESVGVRFSSGDTSNQGCNKEFEPYGHIGVIVLCGRVYLGVHHLCPECKEKK